MASSATKEMFNSKKSIHRRPTMKWKCEWLGKGFTTIMILTTDSNCLPFEAKRLKQRYSDLYDYSNGICFLQTKKDSDAVEGDSDEAESSKVAVLPLENFIKVFEDHKLFTDLFKKSCKDYIKTWNSEVAPLPGGDRYSFDHRHVIVQEASKKSRTSKEENLSQYQLIIQSYLFTESKRDEAKVKLTQDFLRCNIKSGSSKNNDYKHDKSSIIDGLSYDKFGTQCSVDHFLLMLESDKFPTAVTRALEMLDVMTKFNANTALEVKHLAAAISKSKEKDSLKRKYVKIIEAPEEDKLIGKVADKKTKPKKVEDEAPSSSRAVTFLPSKRVAGKKQTKTADPVESGGEEEEAKKGRKSDGGNDKKSGKVDHLSESEAEEEEEITEVESEPEAEDSTDEEAAAAKQNAEVKEQIDALTRKKYKLSSEFSGSVLTKKQAAVEKEIFELKKLLL